MEATNEEFIALLRKGKLSQAEAARAMRLSTATISRYVTGDVEVPLSSLDHLSRIVRIPVSLPGEPTLGTTTGPKWLEEWEEETLDLMGRIPPPTRRHLLDALGALVDPKGRSERIPATDTLIQAVAGDLVEKAKAKRGAGGGDRSDASLPRKDAEQPQPMTARTAGSRTVGKIERRG